MAATNGVIQRLNALFAERFHIEVPSADSDLLDGGILDSFQLVELLAAIEQSFGVAIDIDHLELDDLRSLARIARLVDGARGCAPGSDG